jgi:CheY-like chemotaxis protein
MEPIRVLLADDNVEFRDMLVTLAEHDRGIEVVGIARSGLEAVDLARILHPDVAVIDYFLGDMDGDVVVDLIAKDSPATRVLVCSAAPELVQPSLNTAVGVTTVTPKPELVRHFATLVRGVPA